MPTDATVLGFGNRWYPTAIETAQTFKISGHDVRVVTPALFIATKLEAFHGRGGDDVIASHDLEDIIAVVDGRPEIVGDIAAASDDVRAYIGAEIRRCSTIGTSPKRFLASSFRIRPVRRGARSLKVGFVRCPFPEHTSGSLEGLALQLPN